MNLTFSQEDLKFKEEVKDFISKNLDRTIQKKINNGHHISKDDLVNWQKKLYEKGWMAPNWPKEYGGTGWSITQRYIFDEECGAAAAPSALPFGVTMVAPVIIKFGTDKQKEKYLPRILSSDDWWCQGYSEPGSGSDLASLSTKADKTDGGYIINGTKTWTTLAQHADMMFILVRTNSDCKPQEGISFMLLDMKSPGVSVKPIITLDGGHEVNMVYLENVKVPDENLIYEENKGWTVAKYLLGHERTSIAAVSRSKKALSKVREIAKLNINGESSLSEDTRFIDKVTKCDVRLQALEYAELKSISEAKAYPINVFSCYDYSKKNIVLIGDACQAIHPIAGQGLNLGIRDANELANTLYEAEDLGLDFGDSLILKKYSLKNTVDLILETEKISKKEIYKLCLEIKNEKNI